MGAAEEQLAPITKLGRRVRDKGAEHGFTLHAFGVAPDLDGGGAGHAHMAFLVDDEWMAERAKAQAATEALASSIDTTPADDTLADDARRRLLNLEQRLRDPKKGILDD